jgi:DNA invertase Pin-like site-specific DNA recombinase
LRREALKSARCKKIFEETASDSEVDRPQLDIALEQMSKGDMLVAWKLDRLARSMKQLIEIVTKLGAKGILLRSLNDKIDTSSGMGPFTFHIFGALAEFERSLMRERTNVGLQAARAQGRKGGRPKSLSADAERVQGAIY